ncbi:MAG: hypothetical protein J07HX5_00118 [halophilic archaeon J07HX5]|nr:MAG: hypothetical protein J07HX5_00118 [halophilic archaeon J07HX5]
MGGSVLAGTVGFIAAESVGFPIVGVVLYWAGFAGFLAVWQGKSVTLFDERDCALERRAMYIAINSFALGIILLWPTMVVVSELNVYTPPPVFDGVLLAIAVQSGLFAVAYGWLRYR